MGFEAILFFTFIGLYCIVLFKIEQYYYKKLNEFNSKSKESINKIIEDLKEIDKKIEVIKHHFNSVDMDLPYDDVIEQCNELHKSIDDYISDNK